MANPCLQDEVSGRMCVFAVDTSNNKLKAFTATDTNGATWSTAAILDATDDTYVRVCGIMLCCSKHTPHADAVH